MCSRKSRPCHRVACVHNARYPPEHKCKDKRRETSKGNAQEIYEKKLSEARYPYRAAVEPGKASEERVAHGDKKTPDDDGRKVVRQTAAAGHMRRWMRGKSSQTFTPQKCEPSVQMGEVMPARR